MQAYVFHSFNDLSKAFGDLKRQRILHPITEKRLALLLKEIYPEAYPKSEPGEIPGGRADLAFYFGNGHYAVFEIFATASQVAQDLRHLEQSNAQARIAILTDPALDETVSEEYFRKRPRDPFPWITLSDVLVEVNEAATSKKIKQYIDESFALHKVSIESPVDIASRLQKFGLRDENEEDFGESEFTINLATSNSRYIIFAAIPSDKVVTSATTIIKTAKKMLNQENWFVSSDNVELPPKYWPPSIFKPPASRQRSTKDAFLAEDLVAPENSVISRLVVTDLAEVFFVSSSTRFVKRSPTPIFCLGPVLAECWKLSGLIVQLYREIRYSGKTNFCIGMVNTLASHLGGFAEGWAEPNSSDYWEDYMLGSDWSCHSKHLKICETVNLLQMQPKEQPEFIKQLAEQISLSYNHDTPRCFDRATGLIPARYFKTH